ncbi:MAG: hypothetical protein KUG83_08810, partial [Gammaproteobacteria bacterium]|nr:hypothetical protein [Gammaproteobacteria bacterium]
CLYTVQVGMFRAGDKEMNLSLQGAGLSGIRNSMRNIQNVAHAVATQNTEEKPENMNDLASSMVDLKTSALHAKASLKVIETGNDIMKSIIDIKV